MSGPPEEAQPAVAVTFVLRASPALNESIYVCGSVPELGDWTPCKGLRLETSPNHFPSHAGTITLAGAQSVEYKYVVVDEKGRAVRWEAGEGNRRLEVRGSEPYVLMNDGSFRTAPGS
eukprot:tig00000459_g1086.t1